MWSNRPPPRTLSLRRRGRGRVCVDESLPRTLPLRPFYSFVPIRLFLRFSLSLDDKGCLTYHLFAVFISLKTLFISKALRKNKEIRAPEVRLIDHEGEQLGVKTTAEALKLAEEVGLDLVEVAPKANPPVCKILDYGKHLYRQAKLDRKHKKMNKQTEMKGVRITFRIGQHDMETKIKQARKFIAARNGVKVTLVFRGREAAHGEIAKEKLDFFFKELQDVALLDQPPKRQGHTMFMILVPQK